MINKKAQPIKKNVENSKQILPFSMDIAEWGNSTLLKNSEEFTEHSGCKTYMNWFDGFSIHKYRDDFDKFEYNKLELEYKVGGDGHDKDRIKEEELKLMQLKLPQDLKGILNLEQHWNEG